MIPEHTKYGIDKYVSDKIPPGDFLYALLTNNLLETMSRADDINQTYLFDIVKYLYNDVPSICWGSEEKVKEWLNREQEKKE